MYPVYSRPVRTAVFFGLLMTIYTIAGLDTFSIDHKLDRHSLSEEFEIPGNVNTDKRQRDSPMSIGRNGISLLSSILTNTHLTEDDIGHFNVCGPPGIQLNVTWHPKVINITAKLNLSVEVVAPISFKSGVVHYELYLQGSPVFAMDTHITCEDIEKDANITCPIKPGTYWSGTYDVRGGKDVPPNTYFLKMIVTNENSRVFGCLNATIEITK